MNPQSARLDEKNICASQPNSNSEYFRGSIRRFLIYFYTRIDSECITYTVEPSLHLFLRFYLFSRILEVNLPFLEGSKVVPERFIINFWPRTSRSSLHLFKVLYIIMIYILNFFHNYLYAS